ncbi:hypothetical protein [Saccharopolyspora spinosa]|uniref:Uncharacterized protein n=1 Tax=Saccharopolyspora spinosa TaxID=60894 RepID=A0A2N3XZE9_SACSN|nr:hypothetical protein A8926_3785 [Saccharopolyspora spinosa]
MLIRSAAARSDVRGDLGRPQRAGGCAQFLLGLAGIAQQLVGDRVQPRRTIFQVGAGEGVRIIAEQPDGAAPLVADGRGGRQDERAFAEAAGQFEPHEGLAGTWRRAHMPPPVGDVRARLQQVPLGLRPSERRRQTPTAS